MFEKLQSKGEEKEFSLQSENCYSWLDETKDPKK